IGSTLGTETSFISVFNHLGYHTAWLTTEPDWSYLDSGYDMISQLALETKEQRFSWMVSKDNLKQNRQKKDFADEVLLQDFDRLLAQHRKLLVVFNTFGSHYPYQREYIRGEYAPFQPTCTTVEECDNFDHLENAYDNTIVYTDYFLSEVIRRLKGRRALFLYMSDHGESIAEDSSGHRIGRTGVFAHGHGSDRFVELIRDGSFDEQRRVPMLLWASDSFLADPAANHRFENLRAKVNDVVSHDNVFHSIIDCAGIRSEAVDSKLSLCGREPVPRYDAFLWKGADLTSSK
ncbi:partial Kdo(2)-lipid A phosphoethanolamine 7''-transferase, partial [Anaerolineales bacterium]